MSKRLLLVVNHAGFFLSHRLPIALAARDAGYDVHIATPNSKHVPEIQRHGLAWHPIKLNRSSRHPIRELESLATMVSLYRRLRPDVVHQVTIKPVLYGTIAARLTGVPCVVNAISGLGHLFVSDTPRARRWRRFAGIVYSMAMRHRNMRLIFQNPEHREAFLQRGWVRETEGMLIPGSGVDTSIFIPIARNEAAAPIVMLPARMLFSKGVREFVAAARVLHGEQLAVRFVLVGEPDPDNPDSVTQAQLDSWRAEGIVETWGRRSDMAAVLASATIVVLPSYGEGLPKVLQEAAACGVPIVTTDDPGCRAVVDDGVNGLTVPTRQAAPVTDAVRRLLMDAPLRASFGRAGRERAVQRFDVSRIVDAHLNVYRDVIATRAASRGLLFWRRPETASRST